jgi:hypothetical protein
MAKNFPRLYFRTPAIEGGKGLGWKRERGIGEEGMEIREGRTKKEREGKGKRRGRRENRNGRGWIGSKATRTRGKSRGGGEGRERR